MVSSCSEDTPLSAVARMCATPSASAVTSPSAEISTIPASLSSARAQLMAAGVAVEMHRIAGAWHGFDTEIDHPHVRQTLQMRAEFIRNVLGG